MRAPTTALARRHERVREALERLSLDALVVSNLSNVFYLTNLAASSAIVVVDPARLYLITDFRYSAAVDQLLATDAAPPDTRMVPVDASYDETLAGVVVTLGAARLGFEAAHVPVRQHATWQDRFGRYAGALELVATNGVVEGLRLVKDDVEVQLLRDAGGRLSEVARGVLADLAVTGRSERDLAAEIDWRVKRAGFDRTAFDTIVASGPNSALPHARPTDRVVQDGELLLLDFGGVWHGYCVDLTRTVAIGAVSPESRRVYRAVHAAQRAAIDAVRAGVPADRVDAAARDVLREAGLGDLFGHGTGHGLGLDVHEEPRVSKRREGGLEPAVLEAGMVCTIEPGAYVPNVGGVRLEDDVLVTGEGCDLLTDVPFDRRLM